MKRDEFEQNIAQLLSLLKKILKNHLPGNAPLSTPFDFKQEYKDADKVVFNMCFFNFIPMSSEEMEELEQAFAEALDQQEAGSHSGDDEVGDFSWNQKDMEFLKRHGIKL